jgi:omega-3 fatty acid desaturase (delta-15 desaturase)
MAPRNESSTQLTDDDIPSLTEIKRSIPGEYFRSSLATSVYYVIRSAVLCSLSAWLIHNLALDESSSLYLSNTYVRWAALFLYWNWQGMLFWGIFTIGHDCGHGSFSNSKLWNQVFGNLTHSFLLVPYESWKLSHNWHHKNTGNIDKDEIFYPQRDNTMYDWVRRAVVPLTVAAWWIYLVGTQHFNPYNELYKGHRTDVVISLVCWWGAAVTAYSLALSLGWAYMSSLYFVPLAVFASWLVVTTFLHHNDEDAPWYPDGEWNYVKVRHYTLHAPQARGG